ANMSGDPEQEYFADGMVEEIITALSRIRWLFVIARNSSFTYKGQAVDVKQVGRELGVRYVLEGSVRKAAGRVRITAQLIDALSGAHLWADRFDGSLEDVFDLQDKVAVSVAGVIEPALQAAEMRRSVARPTTDLTAYDLYLRALAAFYPVTRERLVAALALIEEAIAIDPHYGLALSWAAVCHLRLISEGWAAQPEPHRRKSTDLARQALQVGENDPGVLANAAITLTQFGEDIGAMIGLVDRALTLNPSFARGWFRSGLIRIYAGQHDLAIKHLEASLRLSPRERVGAPLQWIGMAYFFKRQFGEAAAKLLSSIQENPGSPTPYRALPRATPISGGWTKRARPSPRCAPLLLCLHPPICLIATPRTANSTCLACAWRRVRRHEPLSRECPSLQIRLTWLDYSTSLYNESPR
ncbi:MAG TPA: hypothetical protein VNW89_06450, partial [Stellaceae bacterium]|nr:hypothetical protein [Stellaceae bacterium]